MSLYAYDSKVREEGYRLICGVDEAGRGPLAGPVYAAAVILPPDVEIAGVNDSKKLSEKKRALIFDQIVQHAVCYCIAQASRDEIDTLNILNASLLAMRRAVEGLEIAPELVLVDGNRDPVLDFRTRLIVGGDAHSASIAAASILAKVARDRRMLELSAQYPEYFFEKHKGYGTKLHYERLDQCGPCPEHRTTFLRKWEAAKNAR